MELTEIYERWGFKEIRRMVAGYQEKIRRLEELVNRGTCTHCYREISKDETKQMINNTKNRLEEEIIPFFQEKRVVYEAEMKVAREKGDEERARRKRAVEAFCNDNMDLFKKAIRLYNKGDWDNMLPKGLSKESQSLWDDAFEGWCVGSETRETKYMEIDCFYFHPL